MERKIERDALTGTDTTGHEWDGLKELNTPLPKWWLYVFVATVIWAIGYCVWMPSIPYFSGYFPGIGGYSTRSNVAAEIATIDQLHKSVMDDIAAMPIAEVAQNPKLKPVALAAGHIAFANNCQPCHGAEGSGRPGGFPVLADDDWLWGGTLEAIQQTITHGVRSNPDARQSEMPRFGDGLLTATEITSVADYVLSLSGRAGPADIAPGAAIFADNCAVCHGDTGRGNQELGAPNLADALWLYGSDRASIIGQIAAPRYGVMPAWSPRLDDATVKSLALYVHTLGGGL